MAVLMVDLDDTLVDRSEVIRRWAAQTAQHHPHDSDLEDWLVEWDSDGKDVRDRRDFVRGVQTRLCLAEPVDELLQRWRHDFGALHRLDESTRTVLRSTRKQGIPVVVVTNGLTAHQEAKLEAMEARNHVDGWVVSERAGVRKPERRIFELAAESVGHTLDGSWMIGDNLTADIAGGANAGLKCVWVNRYHQIWVGEGPPPPTFHHPAPAIEYAANAMRAAAAGHFTS